MKALIKLDFLIKSKLPDLKSNYPPPPCVSRLKFHFLSRFSLFHFETVYLGGLLIPRKIRPGISNPRVSTKFKTRFPAFDRKILRFPQEFQLFSRIHNGSPYKTTYFQCFDPKVTPGISNFKISKTC